MTTRWIERETHLAQREPGGKLVYALFVKVNVESGGEQESLEFVDANVVAMVRQAPGLVAG